MPFFTFSIFFSFWDRPFRYKHELTNLFGEVGNGGLFFLNGYLPFNEKFCYLGKGIDKREKFDISFV